MIYTVTPNPTLDLGGIVDHLIPNEKAYVHHETRHPGGNAINAARIISRLKAPVVASGFLGGAVGEEIRRLLNEEKVKHDFISIQGNTRINVTVSSEDTHLQTRLSFPGPKISTQEKQNLYKLIGKLGPQGFLVIGGSLPPGVQESDIAKLIALATQRKITVLVDLPGKLLQGLIEESPFLIKPNLLEFQELVGKSVTQLKDVMRESKFLMKKVPFICVSSVEGGAALITPRQTVFGCIPKIKVKSTVGAGDSMVGAMCSFLWKYKKNPLEAPPAEVLRWGLAAACATLSKTGTSLGDRKDILKYLPQVKINVKESVSNKG